MMDRWTEGQGPFIKSLPLDFVALHWAFFWLLKMFDMDMQEGELCKRIALTLDEYLMLARWSRGRLEA